MFTNGAGQVRAGWIILLAMVAMLTVQSIFMLPGFVLFILMENLNQSASFLADTTSLLAALDNYPWISLLTQGGGTAGGIIIIFLLWRFLNKRSVKELGFRGSINDLGFGLILGALSITLIFILLLISGNISMIYSFTEPKFSIYLLTMLILYILVGFFEEMLFRGYVMSTMANRGNKKWLIYVVSAVLFSILHGANPNVSLLGLVNIALVGILFAYMFDATNSLWLPIGYHITWNYFQGSVFGFSVSGTTPHGVYNVEVMAGKDLLTGGSFGLEGGLLATLLILFGFIATKWYVVRKQSKNKTYNDASYETTE